MSKRQRPCDFCRSRKTACRIEGSPPCRACELHRRECTFVEASQPRKRPSTPSQHAHHETGTSSTIDEVISYDINSSGSSVLGTASLNAAPVDPPDMLSSAVDAGTVARSPLSFSDMGIQFLQDLDMDGSEYLFMFRTPDPKSPASQTSPSVASQVDANEDWAATSELFLDGGDDSVPEILGESGDMDPYLLQGYRHDRKGVFKFKQLAIHIVQPEPQPVQFLTSHPSIFRKHREEAGHIPPSQEEARLRLEQVVSKEMGQRLIALYWKFVGPQYPIFAEMDMPNPADSPVHLLAAIYSISFPFAMYDDKLCVDLAYDEFPHAALARIINDTLPADLHSPSIATVQTAVLAALRPSSNCLVSDASYRWHLLGTVVSAAVSAGLHLDPSLWKVAPWQLAQRRRLSFTIFTLDRWFACGFGRPPQINIENWLVTSLVSDDWLGSGLSENQWAQLTKFSIATAVLDSALSKL